jgi:hypothetical protein
MVPMEHRLLRFQDGEDERGHPGDEELRDDDKNVLYALVDTKMHA